MKQPSKKQTALSGLLLVLLILGAYIVGFIGWGSPRAGGAGETTSWNAGTDSCTITTGNTQCTKVTTWTTPLSAAPCTGCSEATVTTATGSTSDLVVQGGTMSEYFFDEANDFVNGKWTTMPAAATEIFGDNGAHWLIEDWTNVASADFVVNCHVNSNTGGATLDVQYSTDQGGTWTGLGIPVDINALCGPNVYGHDGPGDTCLTASAAFGCFTNIPAGAKLQGVFLRIIGSGGGGLGDNPDFTYAYVNVKASSTTVKFFYGATLGGTTATQITIIARINVVQTGSTTVSWKMEAWVCKAGGSGPC